MIDNNLTPAQITALQAENQRLREEIAEWRSTGLKVEELNQIESMMAECAYQLDLFAKCADENTALRAELSILLGRSSAGRHGIG